MNDINLVNQNSNMNVELETTFYNEGDYNDLVDRVGSIANGDIQVYYTYGNEEDLDLDYVGTCDLNDIEVIVDNNKYINQVELTSLLTGESFSFDKEGNMWGCLDYYRNVLNQYPNGNWTVYYSLNIQWEEDPDKVFFVELGNCESIHIQNIINKYDFEDCLFCNEDIKKAYVVKGSELILMED